MTIFEETDKNFSLKYEDDLFQLYSLQYTHMYPVENGALIGPLVAPAERCP